MSRLGSNGSNSVQNPFDPTGWTGRVELIEYPQTNLAINTPLQILGTDPYRLWILFMYDDVTVPVFLNYHQQGGIPGIGADQGRAHILIHNASYPSLVQGNWWAVAPTGGSVVEWIVGRAIQ